MNYNNIQYLHIYSAFSYIDPKRIICYMIPREVRFPSTKDVSFNVPTSYFLQLTMALSIPTQNLLLDLTNNIESFKDQ